MIALGIVVFAVGLLVLPDRGVAAARLRLLVGTPSRALWWWRCWSGWMRPRGTRRPSGRGVEVLHVAATWDLLAAGLRAGLPGPDAMRAVAGGLPQEAATALRSTSELIALGADPEQAWEPALQCTATSSLARAARRTARTGSALAGVAEELAVRIRAELADVIEARAQRAGVLITGPLGLCFLPGFLCLGVVPVVIGLAGELTVVR